MPSPSDLRHSERQPLGFFCRICEREWNGFRRLLLFASLFLSAVCVSCGAVGSSPPPPVATASVAVTPSSAQPFPGESVQFTAVVENAGSSGVSWQVNQTTGGSPSAGMIDSNGLYTAPASVPSPPTVTVTAVLQTDSTKTASSNVTILSLSSVTGQLIVSPKLSSVTTFQTLQMQILTTGISNTDVTWAVDGGTISPSGLFTPPSAPGAYTVLASLPHAAGTATVEVTSFPGNLTWRNDNARSGVNSQELALAPPTVSATTFGKIFPCPIDGFAYAQPLYVPNLAIAGIGTQNVVIVGTEKDSVFAFDADAVPCKKLWQTSLIPPGSEAIETPSLQITSTDIVPFVGITGTPVIGGSPPTLYVVAATQTIEENPIFSQQLYALDLTAIPPATQPAGIEIASPSGQTSGFYPMVENQRPALLLNNGTLYAAFGSYGGEGDYHGWLFSYDTSTLQQTGAFNVTPSALQGGIWQSGGGPAADSNGSVFVVTGDGPFDANRAGPSYSDSFLRFGPATGLPSVADFFTPCNQQALETAEEDVGATAPVLLPDSAGSPSQQHLLMGGSKAGFLYVLNRDAMGGFDTNCPDSPARAQTIFVGAGGIFSTPLFWNNSVYAAPGNGSLISFPMTQGILATSPSGSQSPETLGPLGATPVISSNGMNNAILRLIDSSGASANAPAVLRAYDPNDLSNELYNSTTAAGMRDTAGAAVKFSVPTVANGKVYVGTQTELDVYGLLQ